MSYESTIQQSGHLMTFGDSCTNLKHHRPGYWSALLSQRGPPGRDGRVQNGDFMSQNGDLSSPW